MLSVLNYLKKLWRICLLFAGQKSVRRGFEAAFFFLLVTTIVSVQFIPKRYDLNVGQVAPATILSPQNLVYEDTAKTEQDREKAKAAVPNQYDIDPQVEEDVINDINNSCTSILTLEGGSGTSGAKLSQLKSILPFSISDTVGQVLIKPDPTEMEPMEKGLDLFVQQAMDTPGGLTDANIDMVKQNLFSHLSSLNLDTDYRLLAQSLLNAYLRPNTVLDQARMQAARNQAASSVSPVMISIKKGEKIVSEGEIVTSGELSKLQALGLSRSRMPFSVLIGTAFLVAILMVLMLFYLYQQNREIYENSNYLSLLGIITVLVLAVGKVILAVNISQWPDFGALTGYAVPVAVAGILLTILLNSRIALLSTSMLSVLLAVMTGNQLRFGIVGFIGGIIGIFSVSRLSQRSDLVRAGIYVALASALAIFTMGLITGTSLAVLIWASLILGTVNGILSSVLTNGALPYLEGTFGITSAVRLLELANPNNILLRRLLTEAPGTYHHSIIVGNMAEAAAGEVGADVLLARVGSYFHDIGKVMRPYFFIENQLTCENPHDKIAPSLSTLILTSHVKDGVELAREKKIPENIVDIIEQHHGTSLASFFYHKALEQDRTETVTEDEFRYDGPKPKSKEAAIVMLADSAEAAVRSLQNRTPGRVEGLVRKVIKEKFMDGQLDECNLNFKDLDVIAASFVRVLSGIYHTRVGYPELTKELIERKRIKNAGVRKQSAGRGAG